MKYQSNKQAVTREDFPDGSAVVTYEDGSMLILESDLAKETVLREHRNVSYNEPPPPPGN